MNNYDELVERLEALCDASHNPHPDVNTFSADVWRTIVADAGRLADEAATALAAKDAELAKLRDYLSAAASDYTRLLDYLETAYRETDLPLPFEEAFAAAAKECRETSTFLRSASEGRDVSDVWDDELTKAKSRAERAEAQLAKARKALAALDRMSRGVDWCDQDEQARRWSAARRACEQGGENNG